MQAWRREMARDSVQEMSQSKGLCAPVGPACPVIQRAAEARECTVIGQIKSIPLTVIGLPTQKLKLRQRQGREGEKLTQTWFRDNGLRNRLSLSAIQLLFCIRPQQNGLVCYIRRAKQRSCCVITEMHQI